MGLRSWHEHERTEEGGTLWSPEDSRGSALRSKLKQKKGNFRQNCVILDKETKCPSSANYVCQPQTWVMDEYN